MARPWHLEDSVLTFLALILALRVRADGSQQLTADGQQANAVTISVK